jgi:tetratricopeptide (TPR) repeat protein
LSVLQLQPLPGTTQASLRERELEAGRLVVRAVIAGHSWLLRRAMTAVSTLESGPARRPLKLAVERALDAADFDEEVCAGVLGYGAVLERHGEYVEAEQVYAAVLMQRPSDSSVALHAARAARRAGRREAALRLYRRAGEHAGGDAHMQLLVRIGEALVSDAPEPALTAVIRAARQARNRVAVAIAREERALLRIRTRRSAAALRDLLFAAARYRDVQDRLRVLHRAAELLSARGDLLAAREVLLAARDMAGETQRSHTVQRLRTVARALGDDLELRRTRGQGNTGIVTLAPVRRATHRTVLLQRVCSLRDMLAN